MWPVDAMKTSYDAVIKYKMLAYDRPCFLVLRLPLLSHNLKVVGSNPASATKISNDINDLTSRNQRLFLCPKSIAAFIVALKPRLEPCRACLPTRGDR